MDAITKIAIESQEGAWEKLKKGEREAVVRSVKWCIRHQHALPSKNLNHLPHSVMLNLIDECIKEEFNLTLADLQVRNKKRAVVDIRNMAMLEYRNRERATLTETGELFGLRHCTVIHSLNNVKFLIDFDAKYHDKYYSFKKNLDKKCDDYLTSCGECGSSEELF